MSYKYCIKFVLYKHILMCQISTFILEFNIFGFISELNIFELIIVDIAEFLAENSAFCLCEKDEFR